MPRKKTTKKYTKFKSYIRSHNPILLFIGLFIFFLLVSLSNQFIIKKPQIAELSISSETFEKAIKLTNSTTSSIPTAIEIPTGVADKFAAWWTIEGWFKPESTGFIGRNQFLIFVPLIETSTNVLGYGIGIANNNDLYAEIMLPSKTESIVLRTSPLTNDWHHIAINFDGNNCYLFVDGVIKSRTTKNECHEPIDTVASSPIKPIHVGSRLSKYLSGGTYVFRRSEGFIGQVDEIRITLSSANLKKENYSVQKYPFIIGTGDWQYKFNEIEPIDNSITGHGILNYRANVRGSLFTLVDSTIPYVPPIPSPSPSPTPTPTPTPTPSPPPSPDVCAQVTGSCLNSSKQCVNYADSCQMNSICLQPQQACPVLAGCTKDVFLCPDGTKVGRTGPNCTFVCPSPNPSPSPTLDSSTLTPTTTRLGIANFQAANPCGEVHFYNYQVTCYNGVEKDLSAGRCLPLSVALDTAATVCN